MTIREQRTGKLESKTMPPSHIIRLLVPHEKCVEVNPGLECVAGRTSGEVKIGSLVVVSVLLDVFRSK